MSCIQHVLFVNVCDMFVLLNIWVFQMFQVVLVGQCHESKLWWLLPLGCFTAALSPSGSEFGCSGLRRIGSRARHGGQASLMFERDWFRLPCWSCWLVALRSCQTTHQTTHQTTQTSKSRIFHRATVKLPLSRVESRLTEAECKMYQDDQDISR